MEGEEKTCFICSEDQIEAIGVIPCDHGPYCFKCIFKLIIMSKNNKCPFCRVIH
jgi:hypothetical protein